MKSLIILFGFCFLGYLLDNDLQASMERGKKLYTTYCTACHMADGTGMAGAFPPLAKSDYLMEDTKRAIRQLLYGASGPMVVNGITYNGVMTPFEGLDNREIADILNYIRNSWGNKAKKMIKPSQVKAARD